MGGIRGVLKVCIGQQPKYARTEFYYFNDDLELILLLLCMRIGGEQKCM